MKNHGPEVRKPLPRLARGCATAAMLGVLLWAPASRAEVLARWTQYGVDGGVSARAIVTDPACPEAAIDGVAAPMVERAAPAGAFPERVCELALTDAARQVTIAGVAVPPAAGRLDRIVVIGDTGCRIKGSWAQDCDDPQTWVFASVAAAAAAAKPDLVIHVGDYHYREAPCPVRLQPGCAGSPYGDNWPSWAVDFFTPATPLLGAAPWIMVRGNHEICSRAGLGWSRMLSPEAFDPALPCPEKDPLFSVDIDGLSFSVLDTSYPPDGTVDPAMAAILRQELALIAEAAQKAPTWLLTHKPAWALTPAAHDHIDGASLTYAAAAGERLPDDLQIALSGHVHLFESLTFTNGGAGQLVIGNSGTLLERPLPRDLAGLKAGDRTVAAGLELHEFGFLLVERTADGWSGRMIDNAGRTAATCTIVPGPLSCRLAP